MVVQRTGGEGIGDHHALWREDLLHFFQKFLGQHVLGNVLAGKGIQHDEVELAASESGALDEDTGIHHVGADLVVLDIIEEIPGHIDHSLIDLQHFDIGIGVHLVQRRWQRAAAESGNQDVLRIRIHQQAGHGHLGVVEHKLTGVGGVHAGLIALAAHRIEQQAAPATLFGHEDVAVDGALFMQHLCRIHLNAHQSQQHDTGLAPAANQVFNSHSDVLRQCLSRKGGGRW